MLRPQRPLSLSRLLPVIALVALAACSKSSPTTPEPTILSFDVSFVYESHVEPGPVFPPLAGFCAHHMLGRSWIDVYRNDLPLRNLGLQLGDDGKWRGTALEVIGGVPLAAVVQDLACCTYEANTCQPVEGLTANGVPLTRIATVNLPGGVIRRGLAFQISASGEIIP